MQKFIQLHEIKIQSIYNLLNIKWNVYEIKSKVIPNSVFYLEIESFFHGFLLNSVEINWFYYNFTMPNDCRVYCRLAAILKEY